MRVAIYSRKSIETDTGESIKNQIKLCKEYFDRQDSSSTYEIFEDEGFSGSNTNRPSFKRMMELVKIKQFDIVAVYKIDRVARNIVDFVNIYDELDKLNIRLVSITEGFDPSTPVGKMMMLLLASFAEMERMNIAQRVRDNMRELAKLGRWSGGTPPTGYKTKRITENGKNVTYLELIEEESIYIKEIFKKYANGYSSYAISKSLKEKGLNYPQKTIQNILANPTYLIASKEAIKYLENKGYAVYGEANGCGFLPYNRRPRTKGKKLWNDKSKFVGVSKHKGIIDLDLWMNVQNKLNEKSVDPHPSESNFTFLSGGIVKCKCGSSMFVSQGRVKKDGTKSYYFRCMGKKSGKACDNKFLKVDIAEKAIIEYLSEFIDRDKLLEYICANKESKNYEREIQIIKKKVSSNNNSINNLIDNLSELSGEAAKPIRKRIEEVTAQNISLNEELLKLERAKLLENIDKNNLEAIHIQIERFVNTNDIEFRRLCIKTIIKEITWDSSTGLLHAKLLV